MATPLSKSAQELEQLRAKHTTLDRKKTTAEANLKTATTNLDAQKAQARQLYDTDDLAELRKKLEEMRQSNQRKLDAYKKHLEEIESNLAKVETETSNEK